ncbi:glycosyltransferase family 2 protein [uncultured Christiangramia sp.]|uniref:glycosyltransferase family 2 protein n=1 Tax=uncultured Christiangramia sp. TaxID=503836 RepID=UPI0026075B4A|nr:glycosyltransferase family 2 protein [uncultured Christiangramia sp.]
MKSLVSIIIPTYNRAHLIGETLDSVIAQTYKNWECIVVDDGSTDYTEELLKFYCEKDNRIQFYHRPTNRRKGANACRNYGFKLSKGEFLIFLDSDDLLDTPCIDNRIRTFKESLDFLIFSTAKLIDGEKTTDIINNDPFELSNQTYLKMFLAYKLPWQTSSVIWRSKVLEKFSFDEYLQRLQDVDFHTSILNLGEYSFKRINKIDSYYRINKSIRDDIYLNQVINSFIYFFTKVYTSSLIKYEKNFLDFVDFFLSRFLYPNDIEYYKHIRFVEKELLKKANLNYRQRKLLGFKLWLDKNGIRFKGYVRLRSFILRNLVDA